MKNRLTHLVLLWLAWSIIMVGYMQFVSLRYKPSRPDNALTWSAQETTSRSNIGKIYLLEPLLNSQVAWDSEYYLSIATVGYEDIENVQPVEATGEIVSKSYAFFPLYPYLMKALRVIFLPFGVTEIGASSLAGLAISLLGTLAGLIAIYDIAKEQLGEDSAFLAAFMMLVFPTSFFFATIYTEGLFVGLAFGSLAMLRRKQWLYAGILAALATWTRSVGAVLLLPLLLAWGMDFSRAENKRTLLMQLPFLFAPLLAYGIWRYFVGVQFDFVQDNWFGNKMFDFSTTFEAWRQILEHAQEFSESRVHVILGLSSVALALFSCLFKAKQFPSLAMFGFLALLIPMTGGWTGTNSAMRYVLVVPTLWIMLGQWSKNSVFEKSWTLLSVLLLAMQAFLFSFDMWVA